MTGLIVAASIIVAVMVLVGVYILVVRPWHLHWGATEEEINEVLPGDEIVDEPKTQATHAITIDAPPHDVWPWLAQLGQDRAGFYSYTWLENLFGCHMRNTYRVVEEWQELQSGGEVRFHPRLPPFPAPIVWPNEALVIGGYFDPKTMAAVHGDVPDPDGLASTSWAFILNEMADGRTRLIVRLRGRWPDGVGGWLANRLFWEPAHFIMERRMMRVIKRLAEDKAREERRVATAA